MPALVLVAGILVAGILVAGAAAAQSAREVGAPSGRSATGSLGEARSSHTATRLFGGTVLVAGGLSAGQALASAELYDPRSGDWTTTSALGAARASHTATALPDGRVVVVGGTGSGGTSLASTEIYDPRTNTWSASGSLATARASHTATLLPSGQILVVGGAGSDGGSLGSAEVYNPATGTWRATGAPSTARSAHSATLLSDGKVLVAGGTSVNGTRLASAELYDSSAGSWSTTGSMSTARSAHAATALGDQVSGGADPRVLVTGGVGSNGSRQSSAELYDPRNGTWSATGGLASGRSSHSAALLPDGSVLVTGGTGAGAARGRSFAELYDPATARWKRTQGRPPRGVRSSHTVTVLLSGRVLVAGGRDATGESLRSAEVYKPDLGPRWQPTASLEDARSGHTATLLPDGDVLVAGGHRTTTAVTPPRQIEPLASTELYRPATGRWSAGGPLGRARSFQTATLLRGSPAQCGENCGKVLLTGGIGANATGRAETVASAELYDPATRSWSATGSMGTARALHTATLLPNGKVLVVAGAGPGGAEPRNANQLASAELYDPATETWTQTGSLTGTTTPPATNTPRGARFGHTAALLNKGACAGNCGKVLIAGGVGGLRTGPALASSELYDPTTGTFTATSSLDQARQSKGSTVLPNGKVLVVGGFHNPFGIGPPNLATSETYDPATEAWSRTGPLGARRIAHTTTLLHNGSVLVAGGAAGANSPGFNAKPGPALFSSELFNPATDSWTQTRSLNQPRAYHTATLLPSGPASVCRDKCGEVLVVGGDAELIGTFAPYFDLKSPLGSAELYTSSPQERGRGRPERGGPKRSGPKRSGPSPREGGRGRPGRDGPNRPRAVAPRPRP